MEGSDGGDKKRPYINALLFCSFAICRSFKPSAAFLVEFLASKDLKDFDGEAKNISQNILVWFTYGRLPALLLCTLLCHFWGCRNVVIMGAICALFCTVTTLLSDQLILLQASQVSMSISFAAFLAFEALQFHCLNRNGFQFIAHMTKGSTFVASFTSSLVGQGLKYYVSNQVLFIITVCFEFMGLLIAIALPADKTVPQSEADDSLLIRLLETNDTELESNVEKKRQKNPLHTHSIWEIFKNSNMWKWALWYICCYGVHDLSMTYWQVLAKIKMSESSIKLNRNGLILSSANLFAAIATISTSRLKLLRKLWNIIMTVSPAFMAVCMLFMAKTDLLGFYAAFVLLQGSFEVSYATRNASIAFVLNEMGFDRTTKYSLTYFLSKIMWITCGVSLLFELVFGLILRFITKTTFADKRVWESMSVVLMGCSLTFVVITFLRPERLR